MIPNVDSLSISSSVVTQTLWDALAFAIGAFTWAAKPRDNPV